jgi:hypothetical protein
MAKNAKANAKRLEIQGMQKKRRRPRQMVKNNDHLHRMQIDIIEIRMGIIEMWC